MKSSNLEVLAYVHTHLGPLCLRRRELLSSPGFEVVRVEPVTFCDDHVDDERIDCLLFGA